MHHQNHSLPEFDLNSQRNRRATGPQDHPRTATLVSDLPLSQNQKPDSPVAFDHDNHFDNKTASSQDFPVHSDRIQLDLRVLWLARFNWVDYSHENDGRDQGCERIGQRVWGTIGSLQHVGETLPVTENRQDSKTVFNHDSSIRSMCEQSSRWPLATTKPNESPSHGQKPIPKVLQNDWIPHVEVKHRHITKHNIPFRWMELPDRFLDVFLFQQEPRNSV